MKLSYRILCSALALIALIDVAAAAIAEDKPAGRWSEEKANRWYANQPWPVGCNYIPSFAINQIETWQADSFEPKTIDRELRWAEDLGFNTVRIFLHDLVWEANPTTFKKRLGVFFDICQKHHIHVIVTFFTNGCYGYMGEPYLGKQPDPTPGVHNSGWVQSPGAVNVNNPAKWERLEKYTKDIVGSFADDNRILLWCLYNEPENPAKGAQSLPLMRKVFEWARSVHPTQPLTSPMISLQPNAINCFLGEHCDVISFHCYDNAKIFEQWIKTLKTFHRPIVCTEYMARPRCTFEQILPILKREHVGAMSFGLVAGKMQTYFPWGSKKGSPEPKVWLHDILRLDGAPYDAKEIATIKELTGRLQKNTPSK